LGIKKCQYGIAIAGKKPQGILESGSNIQIPRRKKETKGFFRSLLLIWRVIIGSLAGFLFIPIALLGYLFSSGKQRNIAPEYREKAQHIPGDSTDHYFRKSYCINLVDH
jgi:MPBQ/MSBQ methyltransferase